MTGAVAEIALPEVDISIIQRGVGPVGKSDIAMAETASGLIVGFQVDVMAGVEKVLRERRVEVRLYDIIYQLTSDVRDIAERLIPPVSEERIIGAARVIALFKSSRKGIIAGCEVRDGLLAVGERFRIVSAMGPVYDGTIQSLHIGENEVQRAAAGKQVGIKIKDFSKIKVGDILESYRTLPKKAQAWSPSGNIIRK